MLGCWVREPHGDDGGDSTPGACAMDEADRRCFSSMQRENGPKKMTPHHASSGSVSGTSVLECLWLEAQSDVHHVRLKAVDAPRLDKLRAAGTFEVRLGEVAGGRSGRLDVDVKPEAERLI